MTMVCRRSLQKIMKTVTGYAAVSVLMFIGCVIPAGAQTTEYFGYPQFEAATQSLTIVDFDELTAGNGALAGSEFAGLGLTIVQRDAEAMNVIAVGVGYAFVENANSQPNVISTSIGMDGGYGDLSDNYDFILSDPSPAAGIWIGNVEPGTTVVQFLDSQEAVIAEEELAGGHEGIIGASDGQNRIFYGVTSDQQIATIRTVEGPGDSDGVTYDDVQFGSTLVPMTTASWGRIKELFR